MRAPGSSGAFGRHRILDSDSLSNTIIHHPLWALVHFNPAAAVKHKENQQEGTKNTGLQLNCTVRRKY